MLTTELRQRALTAHQVEQQRLQTREDIANTGYLKRALKQVLGIDASPTSGEIEIDGMIFRGTADHYRLHLHIKMPDERWAYVAGLEDLGACIEKMDEMHAASHSIAGKDIPEAFAHDDRGAVAGQLQRVEILGESDHATRFNYGGDASREPGGERETLNADHRIAPARTRSL
jgi:hypothetical protein